MKLLSPILFLDIESTGIDINTARIVELSTVKIDTDGVHETKTIRINPEVEIPKEATEIHGITNEDVKDCPTFKQIAKSLFSYISSVDVLAGFNSNKYDYPLLYTELLRVGIQWDYSKKSFIDVGNIFKIKEERTLQAATKFYLDAELKDAHSAKADVEATAAIFFAQLDKYPDLPHSFEEISKFSNFDSPIADLSGKFAFDSDGDYIFTFGKHR